MLRDKTNFYNTLRKQNVLLLTLAELTAGYCSGKHYRFEAVRIAKNKKPLAYEIKHWFLPWAILLEGTSSITWSCLIRNVTGLLLLRKMSFLEESSVSFSLFFFFFTGALLTVEHVKNDVEISVEEGNETLLCVSE